MSRNLFKNIKRDQNLTRAIQLSIANVLWLILAKPHLSSALTLILPLVPKITASFGRSTAIVHVHTASRPRENFSVSTMLSSTPTQHTSRRIQNASMLT